MGRADIDIDDESCAAVVRRDRVRTTHEAADLALRAMASKALDVDDVRALRGSGWEGDLDAMRDSRPD